MNILLIGAIALGGVAAWFLLGKPTSIEGIQAGIEGITHANAGFTSYSRGGGYGGGTTITGPGFVYQRGGGPGGGVSMHGVPPPGYGHGGGGGFYPPPPPPYPYPVPMDSIRGGNFGSAPIFGAGPEYGLEGKIGQSPYANPLPSMGSGAAIPPFVGGIGQSPLGIYPFVGDRGEDFLEGATGPGGRFGGFYGGGGGGPGMYGFPTPLYGGHLRHGGYEFGGRMRGGYPPFPDPYSHPYGYLGGYPAPVIPPVPDYDDFYRRGGRHHHRRGGIGPWYNNPFDRRLLGGGGGDHDHDDHRRFGWGGGGDHDHDGHGGGGLLGNIFGGIFGR